MNHRLPLLALLVAASCAPPAAAPATAPPSPKSVAQTPAAGEAATPPPTPGIRLSRAVLPERYRATLTVVPGDPTLKGEIEIDLALNRDTDFVWLNATGLTVDEAHVDAGGKRIATRVVAGDEDHLGFALAEKATAGKARLSITYRGAISPRDDRGVFVEEEEGKKYLFTQFENIEARKAFPCFDEPSFKVPWQLTLKVKGDDIALSNTPSVSETPVDGGMKIVRFAETKPLPSYLVAFAVGPFDLVDAGKAGKNGTPMRIAVPRGKAAEARWAAATTPALLGLLEDYFGIPYPYEKLDVVPVPKLVSFGAMENAGLITFRMNMSLATPAEETIGWKRKFSSIMAHELAHQWFGDLVTMEFWDELWLNESFAEWMGSKIVATWKPEWHEEEHRAIGIAWAMESDGLATARKIRQEITSKDDIQNAFDAITYEKGAAVISMFETWVGEDKLRKGIRHYLDTHAHKNATSHDFFEAISAEADRELTPAFSSFLNQAGVPLVKADLVCGKGKAPALAFSQERFLPAGSEGTAAQTWELPVCVRYGAGSAPGKACTLITGPTAELPLPGASTCPDWVLVNQGGAGYYRVAYKADALGALLGKRRELLTVPERLAVIRDAGALAEAGKLPIADVLSLVPELMKDPSPHVLRSAAELVFEVRHPLIPDALRPAYARFIQKTFGKKGREIGLRPKAGEDDETRLLRPLLLFLAADRGEDKALLAEAQKLAVRWLDDPGSLDPDVIDAVLGLAARHGDRKLFDRIHVEAKKATEQNRRMRLLRAMASFRDPALVNESLSIAVSDEFDARDALLLLFFQDPQMSDVVFSFVKQRFDAVVARVPGELQGELPRLGESFCDAAHRADVEAFFKNRVAKLTGGPRTLAQTLEAISLCSALREKQLDSLTAFLKKQ